jgi:hypothetical protein
MAANGPRNQGRAAPMNAPTVRSLRVGIALGDHFIDERLFRSRDHISIGQTGKNTFSIPVEDLPKAWQLFTAEGGRYVLHFTEAMDGRLSDGQNVYTCEALRGSGAVRRGDHWAVPLVETARGKVELGQMKLLFQFVSAPPVQPRPRLPASVRGTLADRIDPILAIAMAVSILVHFAIALFALRHDKTVYSKNDQLFREFAQDTFTDKVIVTEVEMAAGTATEAILTGTEPTPRDRSQDRIDHPARNSNGSASEEPRAPDEARIAEAINSTALVSAITGDSGTGGRYSPMNEIDGGAELIKSIEHALGNDFSTIGGADQRRARDAGSGKIGTGRGGDVGEVGRGGEGVGGKTEEKVSRTNLGQIDDFIDTTLDPETVAKIIRSRYLQGIKRCHERLLKQSPSAKGRVQVRFAVGPTGGVTKSTVKGFDPTVDSCIHDLTLKWRFGAPKDDEGKPTSAEFQIPLILEPGK